MEGLFYLSCSGLAEQVLWVCCTPAGAGGAPTRCTGHNAGSSAENRRGCPEEICNKAGEQVVAKKTRVWRVCYLQGHHDSNKRPMLGCSAAG